MPRQYQTLTKSLEELRRINSEVDKAARELEIQLAGGTYRQRARRAIAERRRLESAEVTETKEH